MTRVIAVDPERPDMGVIAEAAEVLRGGGLVAFPTETVYGLGAHALDRAAVRRIFDAKGRPANDPLIVHVSTLDEARPLAASFPAVADSLARRFWPGPLTLVLERSETVPDEVTAGLRTVAIRIPAHPVARALLQAAGVPVAAPSANLFSRPSPTRAAHVVHDLDGRIDLVLDAGPTTVGVESTVLDVSREIPIILRPGAVTLAMLREMLPRVDVSQTSVDDASVGAMAAPGLLSRHYSPRAPMTLYEGEPSTVVAALRRDAHTATVAGQRVGIIAADEDHIDGPDVVRVGPEADTAVVARHLYAALRELDARGVDLILARGFSRSGDLGAAIQDRLRRAAAGRIIRC